MMHIRLKLINQDFIKSNSEVTYEIEKPSYKLCIRLKKF